MYEVFEKLLKEKGISAYKLAQEINVHRSTFTDWKYGKSEPKGKKLRKIADYFEVSVDYLLTGKEKDDIFTVENAHLLAKIIKDTELTKALNVYFGLSDAEKSHVINTINLMKKGK